MTFADFFHSYWWLMFPVFGMVMAFWGMFSSERRSARVMDLIKSYVDQGKEPPPELLRMASEDADASTYAPQAPRQQGSGWSFIVFAALAAGFATGWWFTQDESFGFAFLIVAVTMGVLAVGSLFMLLIGRK